MILRFCKIKFSARYVVGIFKELTFNISGFGFVIYLNDFLCGQGVASCNKVIHKMSDREVVPKI